ncbi:MAG: alpha/beta hydrolase-fold protein [Candidatus Xenobia bacterium]
MGLDAVKRRRVFVAGTFNDWAPDDAAFELPAMEDGLWEGRVVLDRGGHGFKFAVDGNWDVNWGNGGAGSVMPPLEGKLQPDGSNILLNVYLPGVYLFRVDEKDGTWAVFPRQTAAGPTGALKLRENVTWLADLQSAVASTSPAVAVENWRRTRLVPGDFNGQFPLLDGEQAVFVLWSASDAPVHVAGSFNDWSGTSHPMQRVQGTPLHHLTVRLDRKVAHEYKLVDGTRWFRDPLNRLVTWDGVETHGPGDFNSVVPALPPSPGAAPLLWLKNFYSLFVDDQRDVFVMLPPSYRQDRDRHPVLYLNDGNECITHGHFDQVAANLMAEGECEQAIIVFIALPSAEARDGQYVDPEGRRRYARFLTRELVPFIDAHFGTRTEPSARVLAGPSLGGANAFWTAWQHPQVFGKAAALDGSFHSNDYELVRMLRDGEPKPVTFYVNGSGPQSLAMAEALQETGYRSQFRESKTAEWPGWESRFPDLLRFFWPSVPVRRLNRSALESPGPAPR